jgi:DNA-binding transcriptional LysR family regulator
MEHQLGVPLFTRSTREVSLTELGGAWLPVVRGAVRGIDAAVESLTALAGTGAGRLRIGYLIGTGADLFFRLVRGFEAAYPEMIIESTEFDFSDPTAGLASGTTDVALIRPPVDLPEHRMVILDSENWVACLPRDHRLADRDAIQIAELLDDPIVCAPMTAGTWRDYWLAIDARGGRAPKIAAIAATYEAETTLIARGLGISFTTESSARLYDRPGVVYIPITDRPPSHTALAWNPATLTWEGDLLVRQVQNEWNSRDGQGTETLADSH